MASTNRPSFKKNPRATGLAAIAEPCPSTKIIRHKKEVGSIRPPHRSSKDSDWRVDLIVHNPDKEARCSWKWVTLAKRFSSEPEARKWLIENWPALTEKHAIHMGVDA